MSVLVSVIIPTYNRRLLLEDAVDSVLCQEVESLEVLIVDDGSTDGTQDHVEMLLRGKWRGCGIHYHRQPNAGASSARNRGLALACGEFVQFLDADDLLLPGKLKAQLSRLRLAHGEPAPEVCLCRGLMGRTPSFLQGANQTVGTVEASKLVLLEALVSRAVHVVPTNAPLWRRSFLVGNAPWREDLGLGDDLEYHVRLLCHARNIVTSPDYAFFIREHGGERLSTNSLTASKIRSQFETRRAVYAHLQDAGLLTPAIRSNYSRATFPLYANAMSLGEAELILEIEAWLAHVVRDNSQRLTYRLVRLGRQLFGPQAVMKLHHGVQRVIRRMRA